jgi:phage terminase large subunit-like protein
LTPCLKDPPTNIAGYDPTRNTAGCSWDGEAAQRAVDFFPAVLTHPDHSVTTKAGQPFALQPWQRDYVATLFGWKRPDGTRRYVESLGAVPRKNGKTALCAGLALYGLVAEGQVNAQIYSAAMDRDQASAIYRWASRMTLQSPHLMKRLNCIDSTKRITFRQTGSFYSALSGDANTGHSKKPYMVLFDELHTQRNRGLYDSLQTGMGSTVNRLFISITTAGWDRESICFKVWQHARRVRDNHGAEFPYFLPMLYELEDGDDWNTEATWAKCNPNLGVSIGWDFLREEYAKAKQSPAFENTFRNLYLNQWVEQAIRWLPMDAWDEAGEMPDMEGETCWAGLDMSATTDLTALSLVFRVGEAKYAVIPHFFIPEDTARDKEREDRVPYREWAKQGFVTLTPGRQVEFSFIVRKLVELRAKYNIQEIAADRWGLAPLLAPLQNEGFEVVEFGQGFASMSGPAKELEKLVIGRKLLHGGNPVLRWNAGNVAIQRDAAENIKPVKDKSTGRIDGIVATIMGLGRAVADNSTLTGTLFYSGATT